MAKTKKSKGAIAIKAPKGTGFNSVLLSWVLSLLAIPTIMSLIPAFFDTNSGGYGNEGETVWYFVWSDITKTVVVFFFITIILSYAISFILNKDGINNVSLKKINKSAFVISTIINVAACLILLVFGYLLPLFGFKA